MRNKSHLYSREIKRIHIQTECWLINLFIFNEVKIMIIKFIILTQLKSNPDPDSFNDFNSFSLTISLELYSGKSIRLKLIKN